MHCLGLLTLLGEQMADLPLDPELSKMLLVSVEEGCSEEVLSIVSLLYAMSSNVLFIRPKKAQAQADQKKVRCEIGIYL